ncbi:MAG: hypothetical protein H7842_01610 [Gammaproteobacteria bacterium SHHR-1]|uniref:hypothetical protein n=1 Tax=Magnetovirga frankeli TaxID=947516 RepID=UPI00129367C0|nr:hypothetical protein D5125_05125 [gamma proteobacterium SS-5]
MSEENKTDGLARFGNNRISQEELRQKRDSLDQARDQLERMNRRFPDLASNFVRKMLGKSGPAPSARPQPQTQESVQTQAQAQAQIEKEALAEKKLRDIPGLEKLVAGMVGQMSVEEVLETLSRDHGIEIDSVALARVAGVKAYGMMLKRELEQYEQNFLSEEQIAELWNEADICVPGGGLWTAKAIEQLKQ